MKNTAIALLLAAACTFPVSGNATTLRVTETKTGIVFKNDYREVIVADMIPEVRVLPARQRREILCVAMNNLFEGSSKNPTWEEMREFSSAVFVRAEERFMGDSTVCDVVWRINMIDGGPASQFGWTNDRVQPKTIDESQPRWMLAQRVAYTLYFDKDARVPERRNSFCNVKIDGDKTKPGRPLPKWCMTGKHPKMVGDHRFVRVEKPQR